MNSPSRFFLNAQALRQFTARLGQSRFFIISAAIHFVLVLVLGGVVWVRNVAPRADFDDLLGGNVAVPTDAAAPPDAALQALQQAAAQPAAGAPSSVATDPVSSLAPLLTAAPALPGDFSLPTAVFVPPAAGGTARTIVPATVSGPSAPTTAVFGGIPREIARGMVAFQAGTGAPASERGSGVHRNRTFRFTAYVAKYAGGDWDSTTRFRDGKATAGALPNLLYLINKWSADRIKAAADPEPLELASDALFRVKPPFIFFTGHKDFVLTETEVENLRQYLQFGGAIWGDSSLPGRRSRFDLAFRREMKRIVGESADFEALPRDHAIFTKTYFPEIRDVPPGLNYFREPIYAMKIYGEIAVLYTANDYGDMWQIGLNERGEYDERRDAHDEFVAINKEIWSHREIYFRNLEPKPLSDAYKFGTNIVLHLLTRWEDKLRTVPTGL